VIILITTIPESPDEPPKPVNVSRTSPEPDEQWNDLVFNPEAEKAFDAEVAAAARKLGRSLTGQEIGRIAEKYAR